MSVFRPVVRLTGPDGRDWEIYAYRARLPRRRRFHLPRRSRLWTIEAITWQPRRSAYTWTTTDEFRGHVLAQVEGQLARGEVPMPHHATYLGAS